MKELPYQGSLCFQESWQTRSSSSVHRWCAGLEETMKLGKCYAPGMDVQLSDLSTDPCVPFLPVPQEGTLALCHLPDACEP